MNRQIEVPATNVLIALADAVQKQQQEYINSLEIDLYDQQAINKLQNRVVRLESSDFKEMLERAIEDRKNQLKPSFDEQRMQLQRNKARIEQEKLELERRKHNFSKKIQYLRLTLWLVWIFMIACGIYCYIFLFPQSAVPAGGQIKKGEVDIQLKVIGGAVIAIYGLGLIIASVVFCCWCSKKNE